MCSIIADETPAITKKELLNISTWWVNIIFDGHGRPLQFIESSVSLEVSLKYMTEPVMFQGRTKTESHKCLNSSRPYTNTLIERYCDKVHYLWHCFIHRDGEISRNVTILCKPCKHKISWENVIVNSQACAMDHKEWCSRCHNYEP